MGREIPMVPLSCATAGEGQAMPVAAYGKV